MELETAARRADDVGVELIDVARRLDAVYPAASDFGGDGPGKLGELGRALAEAITGAITARAAEARSLGGAASALAGTAAGMAATYRDVDAQHGGGV